MTQHRRCQHDMVLSVCPSASHSLGGRHMLVSPSVSWVEGGGGTGRGKGYRVRGLIHVELTLLQLSLCFQTLNLNLLVFKKLYINCA